MTGEDLLVEAQLDIQARLNADEYFEDISVLLETDKSFDHELPQALGALIQKGGRRGVAVAVKEPIAVADMENIPGGVLTFHFPLIVCEHIPTNRPSSGGNGTGKAGLSVARRIVRVLKHYAAYGMTNVLIPVRPIIEPILQDSQMSMFQLRFEAQEADTNPFQRVEVVRLHASGGDTRNVGMRSNTTGSTIWYTTDGTHPWSGNTAAAEYTDLVPVPEGTRVRAAAYKHGMIASNVAELIA